MEKNLLSKITTNGKALYLAYDQGLEHGPSEFNEQNIDPNYILNIAVGGGYNAVILHKGIAEKYYTGTEFESKIPLILKLNGKTNLYKGEAFSPQICEVDEALKLGASAVGYTIYAGSKYEGQMFKEFAKIVNDAHAHQIPAIAWIYPRGKYIKNDTDPEIVAYAARIGLEIGADIIKIKYSGSKTNFRFAVQSAGKTRVVLSGGPKVAEEKFLKIVDDVMSVGAIGIAVGRNVWQCKRPLEISKKLKKIIFEKY